MPARPCHWPAVAPAVLALAAFQAAPARSACGPTLVPIVMDGQFDDWTPVLANPLNTTHDGDGQSLPCTGTPDRDCPLSADGIDIRTFASTWDETAFHVYIERYFQGDTTGHFFLLVDVDDEQVLDGIGIEDFRFAFKLRASDRSLTASYRRYQGAPLDMVDQTTLECGVSGTEPCGDGWFVDVRGGTSGPTTLPPCAAARCATTSKVEYSIPWSVLGVPAGTPLALHLASSDNGDYAEATSFDNVGGWLGGPNSTGFLCHDVVPDGLATAPDRGEVVFPHVIRNLGNRPNTYDIRVITSGLEDVKLFTDPNGDGDPSDGVRMAVDDAGDGSFQENPDSLDPAFDTNGNGFPDTGLLVGGDGLSPGGTFPFVVRVGLSGWRPPNPGTAQVFVTCATSGGEATALDRFVVSDVALVDDSAVTTYSAATPRPVHHPHVVTNHGQAQDVSLASVSSEGWATVALTDPDCDGDPGDGLPVSQVSLDADESACLVHEVEVPADAPDGTVDVSVLTATGSSRGEGSATDTTTIGQRMELVPDHLFSEGTGRYGAANEAAFHPHRLTNNYDLEDTFILSHTSTFGFSSAVYTDPDGDGSPDDGQLIAVGESTPPVPPDGGVLRLVVRVDIGDVAVGTVDTTRLVALSTDTPTAFDQALDETRVGKVVTFQDATRTVQRFDFAPCDVIYARGVGLEPALLDRYRFSWVGPTGEEVASTVVSSDSSGEAADEYALEFGDVRVDWSLRLMTCSVAYEPAGACSGVEVEVDQLPVRVTHGGSIQSLVHAPVSPFVAGDPLTVSASVANEDALDPLADTALEYVVLTPDVLSYLTPTGTFAPAFVDSVTHRTAAVSLAAGESRGDGFSVGSVTYRAPAPDYVLRLRWRADCGAVLDEREVPFEVLGLAETDCGNGQDDDSDGATDCLDSDCAGSPSCPETDCANGQDDDSDGATDCADDDCAAACGTETECADGEDDDSDGHVDCADRDCSGAAECAEILAVNRQVTLGLGPTPPLRDLVDPACAVAPLTLCADGPSDEVVATPLEGASLAGEASASGTNALWLYQHSDAVTTMTIRKAGAALAFSTN